MCTLPSGCRNPPLGTEFVGWGIAFKAVCASCTMFLLSQRFGSIVNKYVSYRKYVVLFFGFLLHIAYGSVLTFGEYGYLSWFTFVTKHTFIGNMTTYITSYQRNVLKLDVSYAATLWIQAVSFTTTGIALPLGGFLEKFWGPRWTIMVAALFMR